MVLCNEAKKQSLMQGDFVLDNSYGKCMQMEMAIYLVWLITFQAFILLLQARHKDHYQDTSLFEIVKR